SLIVASEKMSNSRWCDSSSWTARVMDQRSRLDASLRPTAFTTSSRLRWSSTASYDHALRSARDTSPATCCRKVTVDCSYAWGWAVLIERTARTRSPSTTGTQIAE